jgi:predicted RecB family nuclease
VLLLLLRSIKLCSLLVQMQICSRRAVLPLHQWHLSKQHHRQLSGLLLSQQQQQHQHQQQQQEQLLELQASPLSQVPAALLLRATPSSSCQAMHNNAANQQQ